MSNFQTHFRSSKDHEHINRIGDEIISQIRRSKFLIADFTGHRGGVYFEAGALTRKAIQMAKDGDTIALRLCLDRIYPARKDRPVKFALPPIIGFPLLASRRGDRRVSENFTKIRRLRISTSVALGSRN